MVCVRVCVSECECVVCVVLAEERSRIRVIPKDIVAGLQNVAEMRANHKLNVRPRKARSKNRNISNRKSE